jgi:hypothetical protein
MIDAHDVDLLGQPAHALDPPAKAVLRMPFPAVDRVGPELSRLREVIGWNAGNDQRAAVLVKFEQFGVSPYVGAVAGDVDRNVADKVDLQARG